MRCIVYPVQIPTQLLPASMMAPKPTVVFSTTHDSTLLEFMSDGSVGVFASIPRRDGSRVVFRGEYILFNHWPLVDEASRKQFDSLKFDSLTWISDKILAANSTLRHSSGGILKSAIFYDFNKVDSQVAQFKLSLYYQSSCMTVHPAPSPPPKNDRLVLFA